MLFRSYDPATDAVSEGIKLSSTLTNGGYYNMVPGDGDILYYADSNGLFGYNVQTQESKQIMSYINSDLAAGSLNNFLILDEEQFLGFYYDNNLNQNTKGCAANDLLHTLYFCFLHFLLLRFCKVCF